MERLNYEVLKRSGYEGYILPEAPEKVLQFGEGNFLRAFADYWFDVANERVGWNGKCVLVQPIKPGLAPVVERAEHYGVSLAIEPVWKHTVYNADRALEVIRAIQSPNLRIIFDPVNLLCPENAADREAIFADTMDKLAEHIAVVHIKDYVPDGAELKSVAAGEGEMDYRSILRFLKARKPYIQATLENTSNQNAVRSRQLIQRLYDEI